MSKPPRVSIGIPVYNGDAFVSQALESLLAQTFSDFEIVISDNASTDRTAEICRSYASRDSRIRYYRSDVNRGAAWNHNRVFELARGEFFKWNSADDGCAPEFLARCVAALDADPAAVMACANVLEIDAEGRSLSTHLIPVETTVGDPVARFRRHIVLDHLCFHVYGLVRSDILRHTDLIGPYSDSDRVLLAHLALFGHFALIPEPLSLNRNHPDRFAARYIGWRSRSEWFDPSLANKKVFPFWTEFFALWDTIGRSPMDGGQRLHCYWAMLAWAWEYKIYLIYEDLLYYPRKWVAAHVPGAQAVWYRLKAAVAERSARMKPGSQSN